jgi:hypothetical protein
VSAANLVIVHAKQYRYERQLARACLRGILFNLHMRNIEKGVSQLPIYHKKEQENENGRAE